MSGKTILIAEDDALLRDALADKLSREGFTVHTAHHGEECLKKAFELHPDLILLDLLMPHIDGMEMAKRLRKDPWGQRAKVLVFSNADDINHVSAALDVGLFDYLVKADTSIKQIIAKIRQMTDTPTDGN